MRSEINPLGQREGWKFDSNPLETCIVDVSFVYKMAYDEDELLLVDFEELL